MSTTIRRDERGIVSILVTMIMMIVISLIVIGFSQVARRNQRESLDRQLSTQAYYAAESGVNAAAAYFNTHANSTYSSLSSGGCTDPIGGPADPGSTHAPIQLNATDSTIQTSCLMVDPTPTKQKAQPLNEDANVVWHLKNSRPQPLEYLTFSWSQNNQYTGTDTCATSTLPRHVDSEWKCSNGILRVDLVDVGTAGAVTNAALTGNTNVTTLFLIPRKDSAGQTATTTPINLAAQKSRTFNVACVNGTCTYRINLIGGSQEYYARLNMLYQPAGSATLEGGDAAGGVSWLNGQVVIDATGKAQDQLRRVQVVIPLVRPDSILPIFGTQSTTSICKELNVGPSLPYDDAAQAADCP